MQVLTALVVNILSFFSSYILTTDLAPFWENFKYKRLAWLLGTFVVSAVCVGLLYTGAPLGVESPGPFIWDGINFIIILTATSYYTSQTTYALTRYVSS